MLELETQSRRMSLGTLRKNELDDPKLVLFQSVPIKLTHPAAAGESAQTGREGTGPAAAR